MFVQQRVTTRIVRYVVGADAALAKDIVSPRVIHAGTPPSEDVATLRAFAAGESNLLIATNKAEEGMDLPKGSVVVLFDEALTPVSLAQSRGRARQERSEFIVLRQREDRTVRDLEAVERHQADVIAREESARGEAVQVSDAYYQAEEAAPRLLTPAALSNAAVASPPSPIHAKSARVRLKERCDCLRSTLRFQESVADGRGAALSENGHPGFVSEAWIDGKRVGNRGYGNSKAEAKENAAADAISSLDLPVTL